MSGEPLVQVCGLHKRYGPVHAVRGLDFELQRGQVLGLLGANGAGKTSTLGMLAGVLAPSEGRVVIAGHDLRRSPLAAKARLGYLPETPPVFQDLTVDEYLHHCARLRGLTGRRLAAAVDAAKSRCGLADSGTRLLGNLSKGYRQRAGLAQAIVHAPDVVILDEPTAGLDPAQMRDLRQVIRALGREHAVILSTHVLPEAQTLCDRVQIMHEGRLALSAPMDALPGDDAGHRVRLRCSPGAGKVAALPMVDAAEEDVDGSLRVRVRGGEDGVVDFAAACAAAGWGLLELSPRRQSLEDLFISIACSDGAREPAA